MAKLGGACCEPLADHFVNYLYDEYRGSRHVRRVASWIGLIVLGIERLAGTNWKVPRNRQLRFEYAGRRYKGTGSTILPVLQSSSPESCGPTLRIASVSWLALGWYGSIPFLTDVKCRSRMASCDVIFQNGGAHEADQKA